MPPRRSFTPLYFQVEQDILHQIQHGELKPGDQLPSEAQISQQYGVSRITARRAVENLIQQGFVYSRQGKGSFVAQDRIREMSGFRGFTEDIQARGLRPSSQVIQYQKADPEPSIRRRLKLEEGEAVFHLCRVRLADDLPVAYEEAYLPVRLFPGLDEIDFSRASLYEIFRTRYNIFPTWADAEIEAAAATGELAHHLGIRPGEPVLIALRMTYTADFVAVEHVRSVYCGSAFTFFTGRQYIA